MSITKSVIGNKTKRIFYLRVCLLLLPFFVLFESDTFFREFVLLLLDEPLCLLLVVPLAAPATFFRADLLLERVFEDTFFDRCCGALVVIFVFFGVWARVFFSPPCCFFVTISFELLL
jgi:hypothetical protein